MRLNFREQPRDRCWRRNLRQGIRCGRGRERQYQLRRSISVSGIGSKHQRGNIGWLERRPRREHFNHHRFLRGTTAARFRPQPRAQEQAARSTSTRICSDLNNFTIRATQFARHRRATRSWCLNSRSRLISMITTDQNLTLFLMSPNFTFVDLLFGGVGGGGHNFQKHHSGR